MLHRKDGHRLRGAPDTNDAISAPLESVRRLSVTKQHLVGRIPSSPTKDDILSVVRDLCYVQWDPVEAVAPSHIVSFWSRLGNNFRVSDLDSLLWDERRLLLNWANMSASVVSTQDYPLLSSLMRRYPESLSDSWGGQRARARKFLAEHGELRKRILAQLKLGPLQLQQFRDHDRSSKSPDGWTPGSDVARMLSHLEMKGEVMVVGHKGNQNVWGLPQVSLPVWVDRRELSAEEFEYETAQRTIRALGVATPREVHLHFPRGRYLKLEETLDRLETHALIHRVRVKGLKAGGVRYVHERDVPLLESLSTKSWEPRMSLLAPFDNLLGGRTERIFGFHYIHENFLPANRRKFGTFVYPILWGDRFIGRADLLMDKKNEKLLVKSVHAEPGAPGDKEVASEIGGTMERLSDFLGAKEVVYTPRVPKAWRSSLR